MSSLTAVKSIWLRERRRFLVLIGCTIWLAGLGWVDLATGFELGLFAFYSAPVGAVAWSMGQGPAMVVALLASVIWYVADRQAGDRYSSPFYGYWNTGMHLVTFIINAVSIAKVKSSLDRRHELERLLGEARARLSQLNETPQPCPRCGAAGGAVEGAQGARVDDFIAATASAAAPSELGDRGSSPS